MTPHILLPYRGSSKHVFQYINILSSFVASRKTESCDKLAEEPGTYPSQTNMIQNEALHDSDALTSTSSSNHGQTSLREAGRALARIGDNLNQETMTRRSLNCSTVVLFLQFGDFEGVSMSVLIPFAIPFRFETEMSFCVFIISSVVPV